MTYHIDNRKEVTPPCSNCGSTKRFRFDKDYYSHGVPFCPCQKTDFVIGGIRSQEGVVIPSGALQATKEKMEEYGFTGVTIVAADLEKHPRGYKSLIKATGHPNPEVYLNMLNNKKPERSFVVTYEYGQAIVEQYPHQTCGSGWNRVDRIQSGNRDFTNAVYRYIAKDLPEDQVYTFHHGWDKPVIFRNEDFDTEQVKKANDELEARKKEHKSVVRRLEFLASESEKEAKKYRESAARKERDYLTEFGEDMR